MDCCAHTRALNDIFGEDNAQREVRAYWRKGLDRHSRAVVAAAAPAAAGATVLEVGGGIGGVFLELLKRGAASATDVDVSAAYVRAAQGVADKLGVSGRVTYQQGDFAQLAEQVPPADVVVMHRVVCCYPVMPALVAAAAQHARRRLVLSYPPAAWYMRVARWMINAGMWLTRSKYRFYLHAPQAIAAAAQSAGLRPVLERSSWPWKIVAFERPA